MSSTAEQAAFRWMRPLATAALAVVVTAAFQIQPRPGLQGRHLAVAAVLSVFVIGTVALTRLTQARDALQSSAMIVVLLSAAGLVALQPNGPGFLGVFPAVAGAALRLPRRWAASLTALAVVVLAIGWTIGGHRPVLGVVLNEFGVVAFYALATFARRYREANDHARQLIVELEESRAAQAQAAALGERQRLAREMHDVLAHSLSGLVLNLEGARLIAQRDHADPVVADAIGRAHRLARSGLEEARRAIGMLRDDALPGPARLAELSADFAEDSRVPCTLTVDGDHRELGSDANLAVYRVAQEALTNVRKHACPERVEVRLAYEPVGVRLTVEDFRSDDHRSPPGEGTGYGLTGMRERAELLGGTLEGEPTDNGFRVVLWVPG